jgi:AcrR family transcriptional regulator
MMSDQKRAYRKRLRADQEELTRRRIVESAVALHGSLGPSRTTLSAIAEHAGVQRSTLYRHFADEAEVFGACSELWGQQNPLPDIERWGAVADPDERMRAALVELYAFYGRNDRMIANLYRDIELMPVIAERFGPFAGWLDAAADVLMTRRSLRGAARTRTRAAVAHAIAFETWRSLVREQRLGAEIAADLMTRLAAAASAS